jgi:hypothetical protein
MAVGGCAPRPLLPFNVETPPVILAHAGADAGIEDQRGRFRQILCAVNADHGRDLPDARPCEEILWRLQGEPPGQPEPVHLGKPKLALRLVFVGGLASECVSDLVPLLPYAFRHVNELGYSMEELPVPGLASTGYNGRLIAKHVLAMKLKPGEQIVLIGYSKGAPDILDALATSPAAAERVAAVIAIAGAVNGSPLIETAPRQLLVTLRQIPVEGCRLGDGDAVDSLQRDRRLRWLAEHPLPANVRYYSLAAFAARDDISLAMRPNYDRLSQIDPRNDGQLLYYDQLVPNSALLGYANADHWAVSMPINRIYPTLSQVFADHAAFPREVLLEALIRHVEEDLLRQNRAPTKQSPAAAARAAGS